MGEDKPRALVAEDTELGRWAVARALEAHGFEVSTAANRAEAVGRLIGTAFAVLVAAVSLEREDVTELISLVRQNQPSTGLILLASQDEAGAVASAWNDAVIIEKPFSVDQVVRAAASFRASPLPRADD